jgi:hypothetical protein
VQNWLAEMNLKLKTELDRELAFLSQTEELNLSTWSASTGSRQNRKSSQIGFDVELKQNAEHLE